MEDEQREAEQRETDIAMLTRELVSQHWPHTLNLPRGTWRTIASQVVDSEWLVHQVAGHGIEAVE